MPYDTFYSWEHDKLFELTGDIFDTNLAAAGTADPNDDANFDTDEFLAVWTEIPMDNVMIMYEYYEYEFFEAIECYDWASTTADDFYGSFTFQYGSWSCHNDRVWDCWADDCQDVEPGTEEAEDSWYLTSYEADAYTDDEMLDLVIPVIECFPYPGDGFPYMSMDIVCDP